MLVGPTDYHSGSFHNVLEQDFKPQDVAPMTRGTRARELARYVVYEDYLPMMADFPNAYRGQAGLEFIVNVPTTWDETRYLSGEIGHYIAIARRKGPEWYIGAMTDSNARDLNLPLTFLPAGNHHAEILCDDPGQPANAKALLTQHETFTSASTLNVKLNPAGGCAVRIR
jgi:alpha-glucosidase